ncbi:NAD(P)H-dependent glycerol-3-phosphate dehydrogenase [Thalassococcus sp. S3]|uniref:NAD(P)H-dependent glycerol-3-phosphate dehydrogenase n=1 Tax=Thalassococcus sp. S3 TaxID=2017482 RepID=UPI001024038D|nr:NAD(P)H-dependent glycerol-3-phosphate dehydrogenase [Thalassococcus sp. S3]QBF29632.1 glycerol-3-phosphate dehydrogenase [Thalassococcus sp. S3]
MSLGVLGAGAFGTALAIALSERQEISLWARDPDQAQAMARARTNERYLPEIVLPARIAITAEIHDLSRHDLLLLAVPMQRLRSVLREHPELFAHKTLIACCKGMELGTTMGPVSILEECAPSSTPALLTGPSFARDIAGGLPTALTLACADPKVGARLQDKLSTSTLRPYRTQDVIGAELGGAMKNVIAIACGAVMGAGLGDSARAALMTRGYAEMERLARAQGGQPETLAGLSGLGDLALSCTSDQSRNYRLGLALGRGADFDPTVTVEGAATARAIDAGAKKNGLDLPITAAVVDLLDKQVTLADVMKRLLSRPLKEEGPC